MNKIVMSRMVLTAIFSLLAFTQNLSSGRDVAEETPALTEEEIAELIDNLVSPNPEPKERRGPDLKLPKDFDREKQSIVHQARHKLKKLGPAAFPSLIKRWDDKRYSLTMSVGINGYMFNASVGRVCKDIVYDQVQPFGMWPVTEDDPRGKPHRPEYPYRHLGNQKDALAWCEKHKDKSLYKIQLMVLDWIIKTEAADPESYTDEERKELKEYREELVKSKTPILRGHFLVNDIEY